MEKEIVRLIDRLLRLLGIDSSDSVAMTLVAFVVGVVVAVGVWWILRALLMRTARQLSAHRRYDAQSSKVLSVNAKRMAEVAAVVVFYLFMPVLFDDSSKLQLLFKRAIDIVSVVLFVRLVNSLLRLSYTVLDRRGRFRNRPLKGLFQIVQITVWLIAAIVVVSIVIDRSAAKLLTGLGASAALLGFVFKNSILGFVSSVILSEDGMLEEGDWIVMSQYGIDGTVIDITINTVKVRNFDNTVTTVPPYLLTSEPFVNWHNVYVVGGRRIMRSVDIDINTVRFCNRAMLRRMASIELMSDYIASLVADHDQSAPHTEPKVTNMELYRYYLLQYIRTLPALNADMTFMVRELEPTDTGIPVQVYLFSSVTDWVGFERVQSDLFDHIMAITPQFGLNIFQRPSGRIDEIVKEV